MEPKKDKTPDQPPPEALQPQEDWKPASRSARIKAWISIVVMILLTLGYFYVFYTGDILTW